MCGRVTFFVPGVPMSAGSKDTVTNPYSGNVVTKDSCRGKGDWMVKVARAAIAAATGKPYDGKMKSYKGDPPTGPMEFTFDFLMPRPLSHFHMRDGKRVLRSDAPYWHTCDPDSSKLTRACEDALRGILWRDDNQVVNHGATKRYGNQPGVLVRVWPAQVPSETAELDMYINAPVPQPQPKRIPAKPTKELF